MSGRLRLASMMLALSLSSLQAAPALREAGSAPPLKAWTELCERLPSECAVDAAEPATVPLTPETIELAEAVNRYVNRTIQARTDQDHWGVVDRWDFAEDGSGDCEDIQLVKRRMLIEAGLPRRALRMTVVLDEHGDGHAVLTLRGAPHDIVFDNRRQALLRWEQTGYRFLKRESAEGQGWVWIEPAPVVEQVVAEVR